MSNKLKRFTKKENNYIISTYINLKDQKTSHDDVCDFISKELNRSRNSVSSRVYKLQLKGKLPFTRKIRIKPNSEVMPMGKKINMPKSTLNGQPKKINLDANFFLTAVLIIVVILQIMEHLNA